MQMTGEQRIPAPSQQVWEALYDPEVLRRCIPGCQSLTKESDERMRAAADVRIGPIGEGGCIIGPPILVNAIADALSPFGELRLELPLTPARLLEAIEKRPMSARAVPQAAEPSVANVPLPAPPAETPAGGRPTVDGLWKMVLATPMGPQQFTGRLAVSGDVLTGTLQSEMGSQDFTGTIAGNMLRWELKVSKPMPLTLKYAAQLEADKLTGKVKMGIFGTARLTGERI